MKWMAEAMQGARLFQKPICGEKWEGDLGCAFFWFLIRVRVAAAHFIFNRPVQHFFNGVFHLGRFPVFRWNGGHQIADTTRSFTANSRVALSVNPEVFIVLGVLGVRRMEPFQAGVIGDMFGIGEIVEVWVFIFGCGHVRACNGIASIESMWKSSLVFNPKCRTVFGAGFSPIIQTCGRHIRMAEPFLHLGDIGFMLQGIRGRCGP